MQRSPRVLLPTFVLVFVIVLPVVAESTPTQRAYSRATASGRNMVVWGDPFDVMSTSEGTGWESLAVRGHVIPQLDLPGFYTYDDMKLRGRARVEWTSKGDIYVLDVKLFLRTDRPLPMGNLLVPDADAFAITEMQFEAELKVNRYAKTATGMAAMVAAAPGYFAFDGQTWPTVTILLYMSTLGYQFILCWSQAEQVIDGVLHPSAARFKQETTLGRT